MISSVGLGILFGLIWAEALHECTRIFEDGIAVGAHQFVHAKSVAQNVVADSCLESCRLTQGAGTLRQGEVTSR